MFFSCIAIICKFNGHFSWIIQLNHNMTLIVSFIKADLLKAVLHNYVN